MAETPQNQAFPPDGPVPEHHQPAYESPAAQAEREGGDPPLPAGVQQSASGGPPMMSMDTSGQPAAIPLDPETGALMADPEGGDSDQDADTED